jgi:hypothetical protein
MNKEQAKRALVILDRINQEIDVLGNSILNKSLKPAPVKVKITDKFRFK